ncbi:hypothetical protein LINPERHAP1_LOCUS855, partial [Linum perenne]
QPSPLPKKKRCRRSPIGELFGVLLHVVVGFHPEVGGGVDADIGRGSDDLIRGGDCVERHEAENPSVR